MGMFHMEHGCSIHQIGLSSLLDKGKKCFLEKSVFFCVSLFLLECFCRDPCL